MPTYEYQCEKCGQLFEVRQKFADLPLTTHEECGGAVHRLLSAPALQFKGSGWYITDYAKGSNSGPNGSSKNESAAKDSEAKDSGTKGSGDKGDKKDSKSTSSSSEKTSTSPSSSETKSGNS